MCLASSLCETSRRAVGLLIESEGLLVYRNVYVARPGLCLGWYDHLMVLYKTKFNWVTWSPSKYVLPIIQIRAIRSRMRQMSGVNGD